MVTAMLVWGTGAAVSAGVEYVIGSGIVSNTADVLGMSEVCRIREIGRVCEMCMCLAWDVWEASGVSG